MMNQQIELPISAPDFHKLREDMLNFARMQLGDLHQAEDAVQEALAGALRNAESFQRQASLKTWVFAILKNKIADTLRGHYREPQKDCKKCEDIDDQLFDDRGHWQLGMQPTKWGDTHHLVDDEHFWRVFDACLNDLPGDQARVFMMREFIELDAAEICASLELSTSNLHVMLHRARLKLRSCLSKNWFEH